MATDGVAAPPAVGRRAKAADGAAGRRRLRSYARPTPCASECVADDRGEVPGARRLDAAAGGAVRVALLEACLALGTRAVCPGLGLDRAARLALERVVADLRGG